MKKITIYDYEKVDDIIIYALTNVCDIDIMERLINYNETIDNIVLDNKISQLLKEKCDITEIKHGIFNLEKDIEYVCGTINIVKLGSKPNTLKHRYKSTWSEDVNQEKTNYMNATYYRLDELQNLIKKYLIKPLYYDEYF